MPTVHGEFLSFWPVNFFGILPVIFSDCQKTYEIISLYLNIEYFLAFTFRANFSSKIASS